MNALSGYLTEVDESTWDYGNNAEVKKRLQAVLDSLNGRPDNDAEKILARCEYEILSVNASIERGLEPVMEGEKLNEAGETVKVKWPDMGIYGETEFTHITQRYLVTGNLFLRCKYGIVLFLTKQKADNTFVDELIEHFLNLSKRYLEKALEHNKHYIVYFSHSLRNAFYLAQKRKSVKEIGDKYNAISKYAYETLMMYAKNEHQGEFITHFVTNLIIDNYKAFSALADVNAVQELNWNIANAQKTDKKHSAIDLAEKTLKLVALLKVDSARWHRLIAECYVDRAKERGDMIAPEFYIRAIRHYKIIQDTDKVKELHRLLTDAKTQMKFGTFEYQLPQEEAQKILSNLKREIESSDADSIIGRLAQGTLIPTFSMVKQSREASSFSMSRIIPTSFYDKHGNKNITVGPENNDEDVSFYGLYALQFQIPSQLYVKYFLDSISAGKLTFQIIQDWMIRNTWYNEDIIRVYNGYTRKITILELLRPVLKLLFEDFEKALGKVSRWRKFVKLIAGVFGKSPQNYLPNHVCILDSLTLKVEYILRVFCDEKLGLPTSFIRDDGTVEEKTFTALVHDLKNFVRNHDSVDEKMKQVLLDDFIYLDFLLNNKAGKNIRNQIAHGHLDFDEYGPQKIVLVLSAILRISLFKTGKRTPAI